MRHRRFKFAVSLTLSLVFAIGLAVPDVGWAKKSRGSSGGYSRPSATLTRTPSTRASSAPRTPSTSGGYSRPRSPSSSAPSWSQGSATDSALARQAAKQALDAFRSRGSAADLAREPAPRRPSTTTTPESPRRPSTAIGDLLGGHRDTPAPNVSIPWRANTPPAARRVPAQFGPRGAVLLWGLLETLSRPGHAEFFYHHAEDPTYRQWRAEAESRALDDPALAQRLDELDTRLARMSGPRDPSYPPPVLETTPQSSSFPFGALLTAIFLLIVAALMIYALWRRFFGDVAARRSGAPAASAAGAYRPKWFRVGMTLPVDPSLFILAQPFTAIQAPEAATSSGLLSVESVGEAVSDAVTWYRLYVSGGRAFFQIHLDAEGRPDECRYFSWLDEVAPSDADEWGAWLDPYEGMIGWPEFETKDGRLYQRVWARGHERVTPRLIREALEMAGGARGHSEQQSMLYARRTGADAPAPESEYLLVSAIEQGDAAWVVIHVGMDVPIEALQLS